MFRLMDESPRTPEHAAATSADVTIDPRAARAQAAIFAGIERLMSEGVAHVSVSEVVRASGVSRSTFYAHFTGLDDLALAYLTRHLKIISDAGIGVRREDFIHGEAAARIGYTRLITHIVQHYPLYSTVLTMPLTRGAFEKAVGSYSRSLMRSVMILDVAPGDANTEVAVTYVAGGVLTVISAWIRGELDVDDDELVVRLVDLLPDWVRKDHSEESETSLL